MSMLRTLAGKRVIGIDPGTHCGVAVLDLFPLDALLFGVDADPYPDRPSAILDEGGTPRRVCLGTLAVFQWDLTPRRHEGGGMRPLRFRQKLLEVLKPGATSRDAAPADATSRGHTPDAAPADAAPADAGLLAFEEVRRHNGVTAAHIYGELKGVATMVCEELGHPYQSVPVATVKRHATGHGMASKEMMITAARVGSVAQPSGLLGLARGNSLAVATSGLELTDNMADAIAILSTVVHDLG